MTCKELGGACNTKFQAETFAEIAEMSKEHAMAMIKRGDQAHIAAMNAMKELMQKPKAMQEWFKKKEAEFNALNDE